MTNRTFEAGAPVPSTGAAASSWWSRIPDWLADAGLLGQAPAAQGDDDEFCGEVGWDGEPLSEEERQARFYWSIRSLPIY